MADTLLGAVVALFDGDTALATEFADTDGLWVGGIPEEKTSLPIAALIHHGEVPGWLEGTGPLEEGRFDFVLYAVGLAEVERLAALVKGVFDPRPANRQRFVQLTITDAPTAWVVRQDYQVKLVDYRNARSEWVYEVTMPYKSYVQR